jgi:MFS family permease
MGLNSIFSKYPKSLWILSIGMIINITGASFLWPLNAIYITQELGKTVSIAGMVLFFHAGMGVVGNLLGGFLYDRIGGKLTILSGITIGTAALFTLAFYNDWTVYLILMMILGFSNGITFPAMYAMAGGVWPEGGRKAFNVMYVSQNLGVAIGSALGGLVAQFSFTYVFIVNGFTFIIFFAIIWFGISKKIELQPRVDVLAVEATTNAPKVFFQKGFISLLILSIGFTACWIGYVQWQSTISVYMKGLGYTLSSYSLLWTINGAIIILAQPLSTWITTHYLKTIRAQLIVGILIFMLAMLLMSGQQAYIAFVMAMVIMTIGEIFIWPAVPTAAQALAPSGRTGLYQGIIGSSATAGRMVGPLIGGLLFDLYTAQVMFLGMFAFCIISLLCFVAYDRV